jgi:beta-phosphoglucomutase
MKASARQSRKMMSDPGPVKKHRIDFSAIADRVCQLLSGAEQMHYSEIRSRLRLSARTWLRIRKQLLNEGRMSQPFPGMYAAARRIRGVILDLDGVIVDTARLHFQAWLRLAGELGVKFTAKDNERLKGVSRMRSLEILLEIGGVQASQEQKQEWADRKNGYYQALIEELTPGDMLPGMLALIGELQARGIRLAMASASRNAPRVLEKLNLSHRFAATVSGNDLTRAKPDPQIFLLAAERLGEPPAACAVVEDAAVGVQSALAAGMRAIGVGDPQVLHGADIIVTSTAYLTAEKVLGGQEADQP